MGVYVGMDVHRKRSQVAIVDATGAQQRNRNVPNDPAQLVPILGALPPGTPVAFEAAYGWGWLVELLEELELEPHLVHPSRCKAIASARLQERQGRCGPCCVTGPPWCGCRPPARTGCSGARRPRHLGPLQPVDRSRVGVAGRPGALPATPRGIIQDCCGLLDALATPIGRLDRQVAGLANPDPRVQALMVLPGVGKLTAMTLVAEIGDIGRFPTARKLCAWAGLTPRCATPTARSATATSPSRARPGCGGSWEEAAQTAKRHPMFASAYAELARRRGTHIATTAIARRLLARCFHLLTQLEQASISEKASTGCARVSA
jgi:transposase